MACSTFSRNEFTLSESPENRRKSKPVRYRGILSNTILLVENCITSRYNYVARGDLCKRTKFKMAASPPVNSFSFLSKRRHSGPPRVIFMSRARTRPKKSVSRLFQNTISFSLSHPNFSLNFVAFVCKLLLVEEETTREM